MNKKMIEALLTEREGYERRGLKDRVALVDEQLREFGFEHKYLSAEAAAVEPGEETAAAPKPRRRKVS